MCLLIRDVKGIGAEKATETSRLPKKNRGRTKKRLANLWKRNRVAKRPMLVVGKNPNSNPS
jgi:hypothetical protein